MTKDVNTSDSMHLPTVSVIIPTHNRGEMLRRAIDSVLNQTYRDFELIIVSDGSTDKTDEVVASYADRRIRYFKHDKSRGASAARNTGLRESNGKYIAFLDDDDEWTPDKLEVQIPVIENSAPKVGLLYAWMEYVKDGRVKYVRTAELRGDIFVEMLDKQAITNTSTLLIKRGVIDVVQGFDEKLPRGNDGDFIRRIARYYHVDYVPKVLAKVYVDGDDRISVDSRKNLKNVVFALEKRLQDFEEDFTRYPEQKANVLAQAGAMCFKIGQFKKGIVYFWNILKCDICLRYKAYLLFWATKSVMKHILMIILYAK